MRMTVAITVLVLGGAAAAATNEAGRYEEKHAYLERAFPAGVPSPRTVWIDGELRETVEEVLGHEYNRLRIRYWKDGDRSAWILDEIGKELPITIGVTVDAGALHDVRVLEFRESRGWEVRYPFFTRQFVAARLDEKRRLSRNIDGITGATLSVRAVTRIARVALLLHEHTTTSERQ